MMRKEKIPLYVVMLMTILPLWGGIADAQEVQGQDKSALIFVLAFFGVMLLSTYIASKLIGRKPAPNEERIIPLPFGGRRP